MRGLGAGDGEVVWVRMPEAQEVSIVSCGADRIYGSKHDPLGSLQKCWDACLLTECAPKLSTRTSSEWELRLVQFL